MASFEHNIISRNSQCSVCLSLLSDPKQLSCSHTFCKKCLADILTCSTHNLITCPICRDNTIVKDGDVENLKTNFPLKALVDDLKNSQQLCDMCDTESRATRFCCECGKNMCDTCFENHNKWLPNLKHRVESVQDIKEGRVILEKEVYCQEHPSDRKTHNVCTDVCITCKKFICLRCRMLNHKDHTVQSAEEYEASIKSEIDSLQARGKTKATAINNRQAISIASQKKRITDHLDSKMAEIDKISRESIKKINEKRAALNRQIEAQRVNFCEMLDEMKDNNERLASIESASVLAGNSLKAPLDSDTIVIRESLCGELRNVLDVEDPSDVADRAEQLMFTPNTQLDELNIGDVQFVKCELESDVELSKKGRMNSMTPTRDGRMEVGYSTGGIDIFSLDGKLQQTVLNGVGVRGISFLHDGRLALGDGQNTISLYTQELEKLDVSFETLNTDEAGIGNLAVDSNDLIYISYQKAKKIQVFSPAGGKAIREIPCNGYVPQQITCYKDLMIIITFDTIRIIDREGKVKQKLDKTGVCAYAAVTHHDTILVAWVKQNEELVSIDEYTYELKHIKNLITDHKIEKPERWWCYLQEFRAGEIAFCTSDKLYIFKLTITPTNE